MLSNIQILSIVNSIPRQMWEDSLNSGKLEQFLVEEIFFHPNSYIVRCFFSASGSCKKAYIKIYREVTSINNATLDQLAEEEFKNLSYWSEKFKHSDRYSTVKPLFVIPEQHIIVTEEAKGLPLVHLLKAARYYPSEKKMVELSNAVRYVGEWQKYFHSIDQTESDKFSIDWLINYVDLRLKILTDESRRKFPPKYRKEILSYIEANRDSLCSEELQMGLTHGDFNLYNLIVNQNSITALDFGHVTHDSYLMDVARVYHQLLLMTFKPSYRSETIKRLQHSVLEGFGAHNAKESVIFRFLLIRHTITHLVTITRFWEKTLKEAIYNYWVLQNELNLLNALTRD